MMSIVRRRPIFLVLLMIVSLNFSGCSAGSFDLSGLFGKIADVAGKLGPKIGEWVNKGADFVKGAVDKVKDFAGPIIEKGKEIIGKVKDGIDKVKEVTNKVKDGLDKVKEVGNKIKDGLGDKIAGITEKATDAMGEVSDKAKNIVERVTDPASEFAQVVDKGREALEKGVDAAKDVADGIQDTTKSVNERITNTAKELIDNTKDVTAVVNDLQMPDANKKSFIEKLAEAQKNFEEIAKNTANKPADVIKSAFEKAKQQYETVLAGLEKYKGAAQDTVNGVKDAVTAVTDNVGKTTDTVKDTIAELSADYQAAIDARTEERKEAIEKLLAEQEAAKKEITSYLTSFQDKLKERQEAAAEVKQALADLKTAKDKQIAAVEKLYLNATVDKAAKIADLKATIAKEQKESSDKIAKLTSLLNRTGLLKILISDKRRKEIQVMIAEEEMRSTEAVKKLEEALAVAKEDYKTVSVAEQKKKLDVIKASINKDFEARTAKLTEKLAGKDKELQAARVEVEKAKAEAQKRYVKMATEYKEKIAQKNKEIAELKARMEAARKKALDDAKRIEEAMKRK